MMKVVGIIGGGAAGLCAARHIAKQPGLHPVVWEQSQKVGGTWVYCSNIGTDHHGLPIHSSMYQSLKTNLPKEIMGFPDFPFPTEKEDSFIHHTEVLSYLESYADHFQLRPYMKFGSHVKKVKPVLGGDRTSWDVTVKDLATNSTSTTTCDALFVCNGHYSVPRIPEILEREKYQGRQIHSHDYRVPSPYKDATVVVLGAAASGLDIALELATVAKEVLLSHNLPVKIPSALPPNLRQVAGVVAAREDGFLFSDGSSTQADAIIYCTGYEFSFPFLSEDCGISVKDNIVWTLYKHIVNTAHPTMGFIGIPFQVLPFPLFDFQVRYFLAALTGDVVLGLQEEMMSATQSQLRSHHLLGCHNRHFHQLGYSRNKSYLNELAEEMKAPLLPLYCTKLFKITMLRLVFSLGNFKEYKYNIKDGCVRERYHGEDVNTLWDLGKLVLCQLAVLLWQDFPGVCWMVSNYLNGALKRTFTS